MSEDLTIQEVVVDSASKLTPRGDIEPVMRVRFRVGIHGPFALEFKLADFIPEKVREAQEKIAATLRGIVP